MWRLCRKRLCDLSAPETPFPRAGGDCSHSVGVSKDLRGVSPALCGRWVRRDRSRWTGDLPCLRRLPPSPLFLGIALTTTDTSCSSISFPAHGVLLPTNVGLLGRPTSDQAASRDRPAPLRDRSGNWFRTCGGAELVNRPSGRISARFDEKLDSAIGLSLRRRPVGLQ